jgi:hypothetical protein
MTTERRPDSTPHHSNSNDGPKTVKEALSDNVKTQRARADRTASPPEAQRSPHERVKDREDHQK